jgi:hypothetical protein
MEVVAEQRHHVVAQRVTEDPQPQFVMEAEIVRDVRLIQNVHWKIARSLFANQMVVVQAHMKIVHVRLLQQAQFAIKQLIVVWVVKVTLNAISEILHIRFAKQTGAAVEQQQVVDVRQIHRYVQRDPSVKHAKQILDVH